MTDKHNNEETSQRFPRRDFLKYSAAGSVLAATIAAGGLGGVLNGCKQRPKGDNMGKPARFDYAEYTVTQLQDLMSSGKASSRLITTKYLDRIAELDQRGPTLKAVIEINPEAHVIAEAMDQERKAGTVRGPLHGIPVVLKDNIGTSDRMQTTAGSLALMDARPREDSFLVKQLRAAGAVILGKANLSEWANFRSERSSSGWSGRGGQTKNPYALNRNPCGSSSGSAVAVSANLTALAIGTETDGSVICPASINGIVGIKPTLGLISRTGIIPIAHSQDTAGPMARTVKDAALLLGALVGADPADVITKQKQDRQLTDYVKFLAPDGLAGARIGVVRSYFGFHEKVDQVMEDAILAMKKAGAIIVDPVEVKTYDDFGAASFEVLLYEFKADLNKYLASLSPDAPVHNLAELVEFNKVNADQEMPYFGQELFERALKKGPLSEKAYKMARAKAKRLAGPEGIDATLAKHNLDALVAPSNGPAWVTDLIDGDHYLGGSSSPAAVAGYPNISVPAGDVFGLPIGISFFGAAFSEPRLLRLAYGFEQTTHKRFEPGLVPALPV